MKKTLLCILLACMVVSISSAQPRAAGIRFGVMGVEASYEHTMNENAFLQADMGVAFNSIPGFKATATYNFILARPDWTDTGFLDIFAGAGVTAGYVLDEVRYPDRWHDDMGPMLGAVVQIGAEYVFWFPLQLSVDLRPIVGVHTNGGFTADDGQKYKGRAGFYNYGLYGFLPTVSVRYSF